MSRFTLSERQSCDLPTLIDTRLLIQANSGGGKSWCLRRMLEQTHGQVQHLVIDPEGEFASLRERFDYVLAAKHGGDTAADPRSAKLLAERLLELGVSAILDIYELKAHERVRFVRLFLEALVDAPKRLWHPALVIVDEAHVYCPQQGDAESAGAVIDMATRGRKRGFCLVPATQRLSKLHKDAAAECNNKLIGRTGLDVDVKRAADELGFPKERWRELRDLAPGEFFAFGPALSRAVTAVTVGPVLTTHPKAGARLAFAAPPPTAKVKALLPQLADLPAEAEARQRTTDDLQREVTTLKRQLTHVQKERPAPVTERVEVPIVLPETMRTLNMALGQVEEFHNAQAEAYRQVMTAVSAIRVDLQRVMRPRPAVSSRTPVVAAQRPTQAQVPARAAGGTLSKGERVVLTAVAQYPDGVSREQVSILTGYKRSTRDTYLQRLRERGHVEPRGDQLVATDAGHEALGPDFEPLPTGAELQAYWLNRLTGGEKVILQALIAAYPAAMSRRDLDLETEYQRSSRDTYLQRLRARKVIRIEGRGAVKASSELFG